MTRDALIIVVFLILVAGAAMVHNRLISYQPMTSVYGTQICVTDKPSAVIPLPDAVAGISDDGQADLTYCGVQCMAFSGCHRFNYRQKFSSSSTVARQCELYAYIPVHCTTTDNLCQYFKVTCCSLTS